MSWRRALRTLAIVGVLGCAAAGAAQPLMLGAESRHDLNRAFAWLEDRDHKLTPQDVQRPEVQALFRPVEVAGPAANFGLTPSAIWLQVELQAPPGADPRWFLEIAYPPLDRVDVYLPGRPVQSGGDALPFRARAIEHRNHVFALDLPPGATTPLLLRIESSGTVSAPATLWRGAALALHDQASYSALSLYFGLVIGLVLYNLLLFTSVRDIGYLMYAGFAGAMGLGLAALTGFGAQFLWPRWDAWNRVAPPAGLATAGIMGFAFARHFLASRVRMPRLDTLMLAQMAGWVAALAAALALPYRYSSYMITVLAVLGVGSMVAIGIVSIRRGFAGARYFFTAWFVLLAGVVTLSLHNTGVLPSHPLTSNALLIGSGLEMVLLSFALADRINVARRFKEQAQARIAAEHAMVEALSQSQERLKTVLEEREVILESSIVGIAFLTPAGRFKWANKAMMDIFGTGPKGVHSMEQFYTSREEYLRVGAAVAQAVARGETFATELPMQRVDGTRIWASLSGKAVSRHDLGQGTVWVVTDITQRKALEEELRRTLEQQRELNELRSRFVAMTSHEFRTPLAAILSAEELLRHYGDRLPPAERLEVLDGIAAGVQRMSRMMDRVLLLGKADAQMLEFDPAPLDLPGLCRVLVEEARAQHPQSPCELVLDLGQGVGEGRYDEKLLRHIFGNLLSNAIKYSPAGGAVRFAVERAGDQVVFRVRDGGIGIPPEELPHLFASFHRASNVGRIPGTGLGLAIVKNAVEMHRGTIEVESVLGQGTLFTVRLPAA